MSSMESDSLNRQEPREPVPSLSTAGS